MGRPDGDADGLALYYAAARGEYIVPAPGRLGWLHFSLALDAGGGAASYEGQRAAALVIEPEALVTVSLWRSFRVGLGASYRLALLLGDLGGFSPLELSGPAGVVQLQYGLFPSSRQSANEATR